jgi:DNA-binding CsgD family transcriptional regulator
LIGNVLQLASITHHVHVGVAECLPVHLSHDAVRLGVVQVELVGVPVDDVMLVFRDHPHRLRPGPGRHRELRQQWEHARRTRPHADLHDRRKRPVEEGHDPLLAYEIREAARSIRNLIGSHNTSPTPIQPSSSRTVETKRNRYAITACYLDPTNFGDHAPIMVTVVQPNAEWPSTDVLREKFALTQREAQVALLLATRRSNTEIADLLSVSPHTARHHTESVLTKIGVHTRLDVAKALRSSE